MYDVVHTPWCPLMEATTFFPLRRVIKTQLRHRHPDHHHVDIQQNIQSLWKHTIALKCLIPTHCKVKAMPWLWHIFSWSFQEIGTIVSIINSCCWVLLLLGGIVTVLLVLSWGSVVSVIPVQQQCGHPGGGDVSGVITVEPCLRKSTWDNNPIQPGFDKHCQPQSSWPDHSDQSQSSTSQGTLNKHLAEAIN